MFSVVKSLATNVQIYKYGSFKKRNTVKVFYKIMDS